MSANNAEQRREEQIHLYGAVWVRVRLIRQGRFVGQDRWQQATRMEEKAGSMIVVTQRLQFFENVPACVR